MRSSAKGHLPPRLLTIYPDATGTRFTNDRTGHGVFVSIDDVYAF